jgi:hypothetical protein
LCYRIPMQPNPVDQKPQRILSFSPFYYGWFVVVLSFFSNLTAAGIRSAPSVLIYPLKAEFGWTRTEIASADGVRVYFGDYQYAFLVGGTMGLIAACLALTLDRRNMEKSDLHVATELVGA